MRRVCNPENLMQDTCQLGMPTGAITLHRVFGVGGRAQARSTVHNLRQCMRASLPKSRWAHRHGNPENTMQGGSRLCAASEGLASGFRPCSARMLANLVPTCGMQSPRQHEVANSWQCRRTCPEYMLRISNTGVLLPGDPTCALSTAPPAALPGISGVEVVMHTRGRCFATPRSPGVLCKTEMPTQDDALAMASRRLVWWYGLLQFPSQHTL